MFVVTVLALTTVFILGWTAGRRDQPGRHQRSPLGPVRGDGSGWTEEGLASDVPDQPRGPEDDADFMAELARLRRPNPPTEA